MDNDTGPGSGNGNKSRAKRKQVGGFEALLQGGAGAPTGPQQLKGLPLRRKQAEQNTSGGQTNSQAKIPEQQLERSVPCASTTVAAAVDSGTGGWKAQQTVAAAPKTTAGNLGSGRARAEQTGNGPPAATSGSAHAAPILDGTHLEGQGNVAEARVSKPILQYSDSAPQQSSSLIQGKLDRQKASAVANPSQGATKLPASILEGHGSPGESSNAPSRSSASMPTEPSTKSARAFWAQRATGVTASLPRPRTPMKSAPAHSSISSADNMKEPVFGGTEAGAQRMLGLPAPAESAICDRFGNPVLSLGTANGRGLAMAAVEDFSQSIPAFARFREAAAEARGDAMRDTAGSTSPAPQPSSHHSPPTEGRDAAFVPPVSTPPHVSHFPSMEASAVTPPLLDPQHRAAERQGERLSAFPDCERDAHPRSEAALLSDDGQTNSQSEGTPAASITSEEGGDGVVDEQPAGNRSPAEGNALDADAILVAGSNSGEQGTAVISSGDQGQSHEQQPADSSVLEPGEQEIDNSEPDLGSVPEAGREADAVENPADSPSDAQPHGNDNALEEQSQCSTGAEPHTADQALEEQSRQETSLGPLLETYDTRASADLGFSSEPARGSEVPSISTSVGQAADDDSASAVAASDLGSLAESEFTETEASNRQELQKVEAAAAAIQVPDFAALRINTPQADTSGRGSDQDPDWRSQPKHIFVLSNAGKPVFTLHGDGNQLAGFMAVIHAMISFAADRGDAVHSFRAGSHRVVFIVRGPLYLVAVSKQGEPERVLKDQLAALHAQIVCILTNGFERMFAKNPRFDSRRLLGGTDGVLRGLVAGFDYSPWALLDAFPPFLLPADVRHTCLTSLQAAVKASGALYGVLLAGDLVCALAQSRAHPFAQGDLLLLCNFITASDSFLQSSESFTPVCLPAFNPGAFLHAYVHYLHKGARICLVLVSSHQDAFYQLADAGHMVGKELHKTLQEIAAVHLKGPGGSRVHLPDLPPTAGGHAPGQTPLLHFIYKSPARGQFVMPVWSFPLDDSAFRQAVMSAYARVHSTMFLEPSGSIAAAQRIHYEQNDVCTVMAFAGSEFELYATFDALVERAHALDICQKLSAWVKGRQADLFIPI